MNLAVVIKHSGELELARSLLAEITDEYKDMYGVAHTSTLRAQVNLAACLAALGLNDDAQTVYTAVAAHSLPGVHPWCEEAAEWAAALVGVADTEPPAARPA
jgi:hypothetical protein